MECLFCGVHLIHVQINTLIKHTLVLLLISQYSTYNQQDSLFNILGLFADLKRPPDTLEDHKFVLSVIANIRAIFLTVELKYHDIRERYRTLVMYDVQVLHMCKYTAVFTIMARYCIP